MATNPEEMANAGNVGRRAFVKGAVATAVTGTVAGGAYALAKPLAIMKASTAREINYIASFKVAGPAPRGIPWLPLRINARDEIEGIPDWTSRVGLGGELAPTLDWYRYCGHEGAPGLLSTTDEAGNVTFPYTGDNLLRYFVTEDKILQGFDPWYKNNLNQPMKATDFREAFNPKRRANSPLSGAGGNWRSEKQTGVNIVSTIVMKIAPEALTVTDKVRGKVAEEVQRNIQEARAPDGSGHFVGFVSFCTHFCCIPGWKEDEKAARATSGVPEVSTGTSWDLIFCTCHLTRYNPINLTLQKFILEEKGAGGGAGAGAGGGGH